MPTYLQKMQDSIAKGSYLFRTEHERVIAEHCNLRLPQADPDVESAIACALEERKDYQDMCVIAEKSRFFPVVYEPDFGERTTAETRSNLNKTYRFMSAATRKALTGFAYDLLVAYDPRVCCVTVHFDFLANGETGSAKVHFNVTALVRQHRDDATLEVKYCIGNGAGYFMVVEEGLTPQQAADYEALEQSEVHSRTPLVPLFRVYASLESAFMFFSKSVYAQIGMSRERWVCTCVPHALRAVAGGSVMPWAYEQALVNEGFFASTEVIHSVVGAWLRSR